MNNQPQPGDIWERDGERREVVNIDQYDYVIRYRKVSGLWWSYLRDWGKWQSGAKLVERKEPTQ